ncbi:MAG: dienelactone hydrolase family protein [Leptospiraceae bacterium]|nr:dienelactone hydrolase family protein [Leptospiraceae bacterium]
MFNNLSLKSIGSHGGKALATVLTIFIAGAVACSPDNQIQTEEIRYSVDGQEYVGFFAYPSESHAEHKHPGVLVVHEWWGHNEHARNAARRLAEAGYTALAVDMYGDGKTADHPSKASEFSKAVFADLPAAEARFRAAMEKLKAHPSVDPDRIGAIGYCFGGGVVLAMARRGVDLDAVASFHGMLGTEQPAQAGDVKGRLLIMTGTADEFVPPEQVDAFRQEMETADVDFEIVEYPDAKHAFTNPAADEMGQKFEIPIGYNKAADEQSWQKLLDFLNTVWPEHS